MKPTHIMLMAVLLSGESNADSLSNNNPIWARVLMHITDTPLGYVIPWLGRFDPWAPEIEISEAPQISGEYNAYRHEITRIDAQVNYGDHLVYYLKDKVGVGYMHHGVYLGGGRIIHRPGSWPVAVVSYRAFQYDAMKKGSKVYRFRHINPQPREAIEARVAYARQNPNELYGLFTYNCEHFAYWITTGTAYSYQIAGLTAALTAAATANSTVVVLLINSILQRFLMGIIQPY